MKCPQCDAYNKPDYTKCIRCGANLKADSKNEEKVILEYKSPLESTPTFRQAVIVESRDESEQSKNKLTDDEIKNVQASNQLWQVKPKKRHAFKSKDEKIPPVVSINVEEDNELPPLPKRSTKKERNSNLDKISNFREGSEIEVIIPVASKKKKKKEKAKKQGLKWGRVIFVSVTASIIIIGLIIGFFYLFKGIFSGTSSLFSGNDSFPNNGVPLVERILIDGQTWHKVTFYGEDGERILIEDPIRSLSIQ